MKSGPTTWCCRKIMILTLIFIPEIAFRKYIDRNKVKGVSTKIFTGLGEGDRIVRWCTLTLIQCLTGHDTKVLRKYKEKEKEGWTEHNKNEKKKVLY